ncbi:unnamed protein product [Cunninghamella blakesleeana]
MAKLASFWTLLLLILATTFVFAQETETEVKEEPVNIEVVAEFPDNPFGLIVNGQKNKVVLSLTNKDAANAAVLAVTGQLSLVDDETKIVRNLTGLRYDVQIASQATAEVPFTFYSEFAPGELALKLFVDLLAGEKIVRVVGYSGTVTITDPETSFLDPQLIFLYIVLGAGALGVAYIIREAFFGGSKKKSTVKKAEPAEKPAHRDEKGQMVLDESWIPDHHLKNQSPKQSPRVKKRNASNRK